MINTAQNVLDLDQRDAVPTGVPAAGPRVVFDGVTHHFARGTADAAPAVTDVSFEIPPGQFLAIVGPSGCGKTTLLNMVAGMVRPSQGQVSMAGRPIDGPSRDVGFMTARDGLLPWRNARDNVAFGLELRGVPKPERRSRAEALLETVGLAAAADLHPSQLSQGMRQRVAIARTLAINPGIFLLDEPFAALDAQTKILLQEEFVGLWERDRKTVLMVTHDIAEAVSMADRIIVMSKRPGHVRLDLTVDLERPRNAEEIRFDQRFVDLSHIIWSELRTDVREYDRVSGNEG